MRIVHVLGFLAILWQNRVDGLTEFDMMTVLLEGCKNLEASSPMLRLKRHLFCEYDSTVRPTPSQSTVNNVTMKLLPMLVEFDEWKSTMTLHSWMPISWVDSHLTWTPSSFGGISFIHVRSDELWVPDLSIYNSGDLSIDQSGIPPTNCLVYNTGSVSCVPAMAHTTRCATDFTFWPYDRHDCHIIFGSWSHTGEEVNFHLNEKGYEMDGFTNNTEWDLKLTQAYKVSKKFSCCPNDTYPMIHYEFSVTRHHGILHTAFVTPAIALMLLTLTVLWLDSRSTERMAVASVNLICHLMCIFDLHWQLPHNGANAPNILLYFRDSLALAAFALILTALLRKMQEMSIEAPYWISSTTSFILSNRAGRFLILAEADEETRLSTTGILAGEADENTDLPKSETKPKETSWRHFAAIIEWLSFFVVIFAYIIILLTLVPSA